ncbi:hypothetical protein PPERSA_03856 [Pseudocohnilembus persalinus]|uniref:Kinetochore protein Ndc80 CH domain-containing protein n=1 Tax=Pseudocohnilembus persalinus TaxID=266149 RepID=A0A0V0QUD9_PSEPJ|nr:hypothetical protein PPERSA_03856 [Pseudocohnilembus persalinus]|eukprot:KRX05919.1 hypothetical protein PPERSA_03856 [Pseudocohnilembus persalinus]
MELSPTKCQDNKNQAQYDDIKLFFLIQMNGFEGSQHRELRNEFIHFIESSEKSPFLQDFKQSNEQHKKTLEEFLKGIDKQQEKIMNDNIQILAFIRLLQIAREIIYNNPIKNNFFFQQKKFQYHTDSFQSVLNKNKLSLQCVKQYCDEVKLDLHKIKNKVRNRLQYSFGQIENNSEKIGIDTDSFYKLQKEKDLFEYSKTILKGQNLKKKQLDKNVKIIYDIIYKEESFTNIGQFLHMQNQFFKIKQDRPLSKIIQYAKKFLEMNPEFIKIIDVIMNYLKENQQINKFTKYGAINLFPDIGEIYQCIQSDLDQMVAHISQTNQKKQTNDKEQQRKQVDDIFNYMASKNNFNNIISIKQLQCPSGKQFQQVILFLLKIYDSDLNQGSITNEQIAQILKYLGYTGNLSKNIFITIGAPHTYGYILTMLEWLVNMNKYKEALENDQQQNDVKYTDNITSSSQEKQIMILLDYIRNLMHLNSEEEQRQVRKKFQDNLDKIVETQDQKIEEFQQKIQGLKNDKAQKQSAQKDLKEMRQIKTDKLKQNQELQNQILKLNMEQELINQKQAQLVMQKGNNEKNISFLQSQLQQLQDIVKNQEINVDEAKRIQQNIQAKQLKNNQIIQNQDQLKSQLGGKNQQLKQKIEQINQDIKKYDKLLQQYKLNYDTYNQINYQEQNPEIIKELDDFNEIKYKEQKQAILNEVLVFQNSIQNIRSQIQNKQQKIQVLDQTLCDQQLQKNENLQELKSLQNLLSAKQTNYRENVDEFTQKSINLKELISKIQLEIEEKTQILYQVNNEVTILMNDFDKVVVELDRVTIEYEQQKEDMIQRALINKKNCQSKLVLIQENYAKILELLNIEEMKEFEEESDEDEKYNDNGHYLNNEKDINQENNLQQNHQIQNHNNKK